MNKNYCKRAFDHIYCDNAGHYRLCCHARPFVNNTLKNTTPQNTDPLTYFLSRNGRYKRKNVKG